MLWLVVVSGVVGVVLVLLLWLHPSRVKCPVCGDKRVAKIEETVEEVRPYEGNPIGFATGGQTLQMMIKTTYRCHQCNHLWVVRHKEA